MTPGVGRRRGVLVGAIATGATVLVTTVVLVVLAMVTTQRDVVDVDPIPYANTITQIDYRQQQSIPGFDSSWQQTTDRDQIEQFASALWTKGWTPGWRQDPAVDTCDGGRSAEFRVTFTDRTETISVAQPCDGEDELATALLALVQEWHDATP